MAVPVGHVKRTGEHAPLAHGCRASIGHQAVRHSLHLRILKAGVVGGREGRDEPLTMGNDLVPRDAAYRHVGGPIAFGDCAADLLAGFFSVWLGYFGENLRLLGNRL